MQYFYFPETIKMLAGDEKSDHRPKFAPVIQFWGSKCNLKIRLKKNYKVRSEGYKISICIFL